MRPGGRRTWMQTGGPHGLRPRIFAEASRSHCRLLRSDLDQSGRSGDPPPVGSRLSPGWFNPRSAERKRDLPAPGPRAHAARGQPNPAKVTKAKRREVLGNAAADSTRLLFDNSLAFHECDNAVDAGKGEPFSAPAGPINCCFFNG
jgi:hypothetical protein